MEALNSQAVQFASGDHFDKDTIGKKAMEVKDRYEKLKAPMTSRKQKLTEAQSLQQFLRDIEDEEDWIREKEPIAGSTNRGVLRRSGGGGSGGIFLLELWVRNYCFVCFVMSSLLLLCDTNDEKLVTDCECTICVCVCVCVCVGARVHVHAHM